MAAWTVMLRGIRYRAGRSLVVLLLATIATAATVLAPAYSRAAQQSVLSDELRSAPSDATGLVVSGTSDNGAQAPTLDEARAAVSSALGGYPHLRRYLGTGTGSADVDAALTVKGGPVAARLAYRDNVCAHLAISGQCPTGDREVLVSQRSAERYGLAVGSPLRMRVGSAAGGKTVTGRVVGTYTARDPAEEYWGHTVYFDASPGDESGAPRMDSMFTATEDDVRPAASVPVQTRVQYPLRTADVRLDDVAALRRDLGDLGLRLRTANLALSTALPSVLDEVETDQGAIGRTVPIIAVPLVLLCWFVLFLLVASLTDERSPEIALAKLRGYPSGRATRFGLGEALLLIALGGPLGLVVGLLLVEVAARAGLAHGTHVEARWPVFAAAALALAGAAVAALLAGRRTIARPVLDLLRRVPVRGRWTAGVAEGIVVALAGASLLAALGDRTAPLAMLAPALLALVAGVAAARLLGLWSRLRLPTTRRRGRVAGLLTAAHLSRRPAVHRVVVVVTVAVALLAFGATAWDVAGQARVDRARDAVGASRVYRVAATDPAALENAVARADSGGHAMGVLRASQRYGQGTVELIGVQSQMLARVAVWRGRSADQVADLVRRIQAPAPPALTLRGRVAVDLTVSMLGADPVRMAVAYAAPGEGPRTVSLGLLRTGARSYAAALPGCAAGCRLLAVVFGRPGADPTPLSARLTLRAIHTSGGALDTGFDDDGRWRVGAATATTGTTVTPGPTLDVDLDSDAPADVRVEYADAPDALPAVLAGAAPTDDPDAAAFNLPGLTDQPQRYAVAARTPMVPRAGTHAVLVDLDTAARAAERSASLADNDALRYEVWADDKAPADLASRLGAAGVQVTGQETITGYTEALARRAPALGLRLYLLAGAAAILLALGVVLLTVYIGADTRLYELAALRVAGVPVGTLRRALLREYRVLLGIPLLVGFAAGVGGAVLMLPGIPLVTVGVPTGSLDYTPGLGALPVAALASIVGAGLAVLMVLRMLRRARPERLREGSR